MIRPEERGRIVFGCGNFGGLGSSPALRGQGDDEATALDLLDQARSLGLTRFDTANTYGGGVSETVLGQWLRRQDPAFRSRVEVATKVGNPAGCPPDDRPLGARQIAWHLDRSLRRLGVERIDLYYLHEFDALTPLEETLEAIGRGVEAGKIARFGVSNASEDDLRSVLALADGQVLARFTHVQNEFNLLEQRDLASVIPLCAAQGLRYVAFSPLAGGLLTGKYRFGAPPDPDTRLAKLRSHYDHHLTPAGLARIEALRRSARDQAGMAGAALRFVLDTPGVDSLIIAPRRASHFASYGLDGPEVEGA
jgi:aryl-alcohol dehydrogenase-like predicted oxidoreductase